VDKSKVVLQKFIKNRRLRRRFFNLKLKNKNFPFWLFFGIINKTKNSETKNNMNKNTKRIVILLVYLGILIIFGAVIYFMLKPDPSCFDGIKNQGEQGVDCGGPCKACVQETQYADLQVQSVEISAQRNGKSDLLIKIYNPNEEYGAKSFPFVIQDDLGNRSSVYYDFILPGETKYIIIADYSLAEGAKNIQVGIDKGAIEWRKATQYRDPELVVFNKRFEKSQSGGNYGEIKGLLVNKSAVDYETIKIKGVLRNKRGDFLGGSYQIINTLPAGHKREFRIIFPADLGEDISQVEVQTETNIFESDNYLKIEGRGNNLDR
jgi:hypothetical protein